MSADYDIDVFLRPGLSVPDAEKRSLQADLYALGAAYLHPLPRYQVFDTASSTSLDDKLIVTIRKDNALIAFVSGVLVPVAGLDAPVLHTGITVIHPEHRKSLVKRLLFMHLFLCILSEYPQGVWITTLAEVLTSLVHIAKFTSKTFPSPQWEREQGSSKPSETHLRIAREINSKHRPKMCIAPSATFDESRFVFLGSNDWPEGRAFMKDVDDVKSWHRDAEATQFFRQYFRRGAGDEVLQVSFLELSVILGNAEKEGLGKDAGDLMSKL